MTEAYGIPAYKEINPTLFNMVTFPFFFGVMFSDIMHGFMLFMVGMILCYRKFSPELYKVRYMIILMGFFGTYAGLLYNDFAGIPIK